jgi:hypothetical protein
VGVAEIAAVPGAEFNAPTVPLGEYLEGLADHAVLAELGVDVGAMLL